MTFHLPTGRGPVTDLAGQVGSLVGFSVFTLLSCVRTVLRGRLSLTETRDQALFIARVCSIPGPMTDSDRDAFYASAPTLGTTLQVRPEQWPATRAEFEDYWRDGLTRIRFDGPVAEHLVGITELKMLPQPAIVPRGDGRAQRTAAGVGPHPDLPPAPRGAQVAASDGSPPGVRRIRTSTRRRNHRRR